MNTTLGNFSNIANTQTRWKLNSQIGNPETSRNHSPDTKPVSFPYNPCYAVLTIAIKLGNDLNDIPTVFYLLSNIPVSFARPNLLRIL